MLRQLLALIALIMVCGCQEERTLAEQYPGHWQEPTGDVMRTLARNHVAGCGEFYQKPAAFAQAEYAVACTRDGKNWNVWLVWPVIDKVLGPDPMAIWKLGGPPSTEPK